MKDQHLFDPLKLDYNFHYTNDDVIWKASYFFSLTGSVAGKMTPQRTKIITYSYNKTPMPQIGFIYLFFYK